MQNQDIFLPGKENLPVKGRNPFQASFSLDEQKQKIEKFAVDLRKTKRVALLSKRRCLAGHSNLSQIFSTSFKGEISSSSLPLSLIKNYPELVSSEVSIVDKMLTLKQILTENSRNDLIFETLEALQSILSAGEGLNSEVFFSMGLVELIMKFMNWDFGSRAVLPASHCFLLLTTESDFFTTVMVDQGGIQAALRLIRCSSLGVSALAITSLANLNLDQKTFFARVGYEEIYRKIEELMTENKEINVELYQAILFFMNTVFDSNNIKILPETLSMFMSWIEKIIEVEDPAIIQDSVKIIYGLSTHDYMIGCSNKIRDYLLKYPHHLTSIKALSNMSLDSSECSSYLLTQGLVEKLAESLQCISSEYKVSVIKCLNNIFHYITSAEVINSHFPPLIAECMSDNCFKVRRESVYFLENISQNLSLSTWDSLIDKGLYKGLETCLESSQSAETTEKSLMIAACLLQTGRSERDGLCRNRFVEEFQQNGLYELVEGLLISENDVISQFAQDLLNEYFEEFIKQIPSLDFDRFNFS
jgi:hypothetical protein